MATADGSGTRVGLLVVLITYSRMPVRSIFAILSWIPLAAYVALLSLITVVTTYLTPETRGRDLDDLRDAGQTVDL
jgi:hypothetical protein